MKIAIIYDFLLYSGGGEKVLEQILDIYPDAEIYTLLHNRKQISEKINKNIKYISPLNKLPFVKHYYRYTLFLWPLFIEQYNLLSYDLVISISSGFSFGVLTNISTKHISVILTPPRYTNEKFFEYFSYRNSIEYGIILLIMPFLRIWEYTASFRPDHIISISNLVNKRIEKYFRRKSDITIHPPVDITQSFNTKDKENYYLSISPFKEYKNGNLIVETAIKYSLNLTIIEQNNISHRLKRKLMRYPNIKLINRYVTDKEKWEYISKAKGLIMPGIEEFGIVALEAISCGTPVIANINSGTSDIINKDTGILFYEFTPESIYESILKLENIHWNYKAMNMFANRYSNESFKNSIYNYINDIMSTRK